MFIKALLVVFLAFFAMALPQENAAITTQAVEEQVTETPPKVTETPPKVTETPPKVDWITNFHHQPAKDVKEGDKIVITYDAVTDPEVLAKCANIKSWTIGIGRGEGNMVKQTLFMESERIIGVPTAPSSYTFQLPTQMENDQYCIQYTPYGSEQGNDRATDANGVILEALYETWFPIAGSLAIGQGPETVQNTYSNVQQEETQQPEPTSVVNNSLVEQGESGSSILTPTITAFIAVLFACLFI